jgi:hypothetical protein
MTLGGPNRYRSGPDVLKGCPSPISPPVLKYADLSSVGMGLVAPASAACQCCTCPSPCSLLQALAPFVLAGYATVARGRKVPGEAAQNRLLNVCFKALQVRGGGDRGHLHSQGCAWCL